MDMSTVLEIRSALPSHVTLKPQATSGWLRPSAGLWLLPLGRLFAQWKGERKALSSKYHWTTESTSCSELLSKSSPGLLWFHLGTQWCSSTHLILAVLWETKDEHVGNPTKTNAMATLPGRGHNITLSRHYSYSEIIILFWNDESLEASMWKQFSLEKVKQMSLVMALPPETTAGLALNELSEKPQGETWSALSGSRQELALVMNPDDSSARISAYHMIVLLIKRPCVLGKLKKSTLSVGAKADKVFLETLCGWGHPSSMSCVTLAFGKIERCPA